jgi:hypothetical protein
MKDFLADRKSKFGVQEWAEHSMNFQTGCEHGCVYCYAREQALRFKWINTWEEWETPKIRETARGHDDTDNPRYYTRELGNLQDNFDPAPYSGK